MPGACTPEPPPPAPVPCRNPRDIHQHIGVRMTRPQRPVSRQHPRRFRYPLLAPGQVVVGRHLAEHADVVRRVREHQLDHAVGQLAHQVQTVGTLGYTDEGMPAH